MNSIAVVATHCFETLPDSLTRRKALLEALIELLVDGSPLKAMMREMIVDLERQERAQLQLAGMFRDLTEAQP